MDGLEATVDGWVADLWGPLQKILSGSSSDGVVDSQKARHSVLLYIRRLWAHLLVLFDGLQRPYQTGKARRMALAIPW